MKEVSREGSVPVLADAGISGEAPQDSGRGHFLAQVSAIPVNPRLCSVLLESGEEVEVVVGRNERLWLGCPLLVRISSDYPGFYELVGELPRGRWDRAYLEGFKKQSEEAIAENNK